MLKIVRSLYCIVYKLNTFKANYELAFRQEQMPWNATCLILPSKGKTLSYHFVLKEFKNGYF